MGFNPLAHLQLKKNQDQSMIVYSNQIHKKQWKNKEKKGFLVEKHYEINQTRLHE